MTSPITSPQNSVPTWMPKIRDFDGLEIHPVQELEDENGEKFCEQCTPSDAHFWSVYGHFKEGGFWCFENFATEKEAEAFAAKLREAWPHLRDEEDREANKTTSTGGTCRLYAQPYDIMATGFYFESAAEYHRKHCQCFNTAGQPVEEFELQFIDGESIDAALFEALEVHPGNLQAFFEKIEEWDEYEKRILIIAVGECGYQFDLEKDDPNDFDVDIYEMDRLEDLAKYFVDEGLYGEIPANIAFYIDYEAMARDLGVDYTETEIDGMKLIYWCR